MKLPWPAEALAFEESVEASLGELGGIELTRACEADPAQRESKLRRFIDDLEIADVDFRAGEIEASAAALCARAAGRIVAPWPLAQQLAAPRNGDYEINSVYLVSGAPRRAAHLDIAGRAIAVDVHSGIAHRLEATGPLCGMPLDPFGVPACLGAPVDTPCDTVLVSIVLNAFWVLGALETAVSLASDYAVERAQFGRPIVSFGGVQWRLADLGGASSALTELAGFTLAKLIEGRATAADAFALHLQMLESADLVLTSAHQVLGAIGLCEEHDLVVIDRHLQSTLRRPLSYAKTAATLAERIGAEGFDGLYPVRTLGSGTTC